jgi:hypothetical protein
MPEEAGANIASSALTLGWQDATSGAKRLA